MPVTLQLRKNLTGAPVAPPATGADAEPFFATGGFTGLTAHAANTNEVAIFDGAAMAPLVSPLRQVELVGAQTITGVKTISGTGVLAFAGAPNITFADGLPGEALIKGAGNALAWGPAGLVDAPVDTFAYGRQNAAWQRVLPLAGGTMTGPFRQTPGTNPITIGDLTIATPPVAPVSPGSLLQIISAGGARMSIDAYAGGASLIGRTATGTPAAPLPTPGGTAMLLVAAHGWDGTGFVPGASVQYDADEDWTATTRGSSLQFITIATGTVTRTEKMRLTGAGQLLIGAIAAGGASNLEVTGGARIMSGTMTLALDPVQAMEAATKQYVDSLISTPLVFAGSYDVLADEVDPIGAGAVAALPVPSAVHNGRFVICTNAGPGLGEALAEGPYVAEDWIICGESPTTAGTYAWHKLAAGAVAMTAANVGITVIPGMPVGTDNVQEALEALELTKLETVAVLASLTGDGTTATPLDVILVDGGTF